MTTNRKSIFINLLLLITLSIPYLLGLGLQLRQWQVRHEMLEKLEQENLQEVRIAKTDLKWFEEGEELMIGDKMFDVKGIKDNGDSLILSGLYDHEETELKKKTKSLGDHQQEQQLNQKLMAFVFCSHNYSTPVLHNTLVFTQDFYTPNDAFELSVHLSVPFPPPKV